MRFDPRSGIFTVFLGMLAGLSSLSIDPFLPTLPALAKEFASPVTTVQLTVTAWFVGSACGQVVFGPFSDRYGRRPPLIFGLGLFLAATIYCANAGSIEGLIAGRFFQSLGTASATVLGRSIVRDLFAWKEAAQKLVMIWLVFGVMPLTGPLIGAGLLAAWGWAAVFWWMAAVTVVLFVMTLFGLPETSTLRSEDAPTLARIGRDYVFLLRQRHFLIYLAMIFFIQTGIFSFVSNSSFVLITALGFSPGQFGFIFAATITGHLCAAGVGGRLVRRFGIDAAIRCGALLACLSGLAMAAAAWLRIDAAFAIIVPMFFVMGSGSLVTPNAIAAAMSPFPKLAGTASSLTGLTQLVGGAAASYVLGILFDGTARPLTTAIAVCGFAAMLVYECFIRRQRSPAQVDPAVLNRS